MQLSELAQFKQALLQIAKRHRVKKVSVFGSVGRGDRKTNDVDFLIEMENNASGLDVGGFQFEAQKLLGVHVDVVPAYALQNTHDKNFAATIQSQSQPL